MKFLVVNDDGITAPGLAALKEVLEGRGEVVVIAPQDQHSGMSHAITLYQPIRLRKQEQGYTVTGTPADCVKMAVHGLGYKPDLILSGINNGANLGMDVLYSGTVAAALEGVLNGIPSIAVSLCGALEFLPSATQILEELLFAEPGFVNKPELMPQGGVININIPALPRENIRGVLFTSLGVRRYEGILDRRSDPRGGCYYWLGGTPGILESDDLDIDLVAVDQGYVSITPLKLDLTYYEELERLRKQK
ncbi:MAG TPA: 5'/3'-nucleotidase SurE [Firmicutes bacterium]|nr:5'/3'-nucleotidase SurE [Bacillota bacterium]HHT42691.1 5'/3'-nucleotidase SurE [Bacillota bacterium]